MLLYILMYDWQLVQFKILNRTQWKIIINADYRLIEISKGTSKS